VGAWIGPIHIEVLPDDEGSGMSPVDLFLGELGVEWSEPALNTKGSLSEDAMPGASN